MSNKAASSTVLGAEPRARLGMLFCLVGPAGGGKTSIALKLLESQLGNLKKSISVTSRAMRAGEEDGVSYYFVSRAAFEARVARAEFFEWEEVHGNYYGTLNESIDEAIRNGADLLFDIDIRGALTLRERFPLQAVSIFITPPTRAELRDRIQRRGSVDAADLERRLRTAGEEFERVRSLFHSDRALDYLVINDLLDRAVEMVHAIIVAERSRMIRFPSQIIDALGS